MCLWILLKNSDESADEVVCVECSAFSVLLYWGTSFIERIDHASCKSSLR